MVRGGGGGGDGGGGSSNMEAIAAGSNLEKEHDGMVWQPHWDMGWTGLIARNIIERWDGTKWDGINALSDGSGVPQAVG